MTALEQAGGAEPTIWNIANVYKQSTVLFALCDLGVLDTLAAGPHTIPEVARQHGLEPGALTSSLDLMVASGVLRQADSRYFMDRSSARLLPLVGLEATRCASRIQPRTVAQALRGDPPGDPMPGPDGQELWPIYVAAMAVGARSLAPHLARFVRLTSGAHIVDLGGADGTLGRCLMRLVPGLSVSVVDRPAVHPLFSHAEAFEPAAGGGSVSFAAGDLRAPDALRPLLVQADVVIASNVMHLLTTEERTRLLAVLAESARQGATVVVYDQFVSPAVADSAACLVVDWMLCGYRFDDTEQAFAEHMQRAGLADVRHRRARGVPGAMVSGRVARVARI